MTAHRHVTAAACIASTLVLFGAIALRSAPVHSWQEPKPAISTMSGVFTAAQAGRGEETYMTICVGCHPAGTYTGQTFNTSWGNRPLSDLFAIIKNTMPKVDPGMLTPQETAQVIAYILKSNGVPPGKTELPPELEPLKNIRIETPAMAGKGERDK
jgi:mono/diheme cytochrome c family protein